MTPEHFDEKTAQRFRDLAEQVEIARSTGANHGIVLADAIKAIKRLNNRAEALSGEWERQEVNQNKGPRLEFTGRLLASDEFQTSGRDPMAVTFEIWETRGGALVAVSLSAPTERDGIELARAAVVEPGEYPQAMHFSVMDFFEWHDRARKMASKLGWSLRIEVD